MCQLKTNEEEYRIILSGVDFGFWRPDMLTADHSLPVPFTPFYGGDILIIAFPVAQVKSWRINDTWHKKHFVNKMKPLTLGFLPLFLEKSGCAVHAHTNTPIAHLFVNGPYPLCPRRKSNWIADRMKKLIKPRGGGGGREGRALFTAAGSVENLADSAEFTSDTHAPQPGEISHTPTEPSSLYPPCPSCTTTNTQTAADWFSQRYAHMLSPSSEPAGMHTNHLMTTKCGRH